MTRLRGWRVDDHCVNKKNERLLWNASWAAPRGKNPKIDGEAWK